MIKIASHNPSVYFSSHPIGDRYDIKPKDDKWLTKVVSKLAWWLLRKSNRVDNAIDHKRLERIGVDILTVNDKKLTEIVYDHVMHLRRLGYSVNDFDRIVMGSKLFAECLQDQDYYKSNRLKFGPISFQYDDRDAYLAGIKVTAVPWIDGIAAIPRVDNAARIGSGYSLYREYGSTPLPFESTPLDRFQHQSVEHPVKFKMPPLEDE